MESSAFHTLESFVDEVRTIEGLLLVQVTIGARSTVRSVDKGNGFKAWRLLYERFSLPSRVRGIELLDQLLEHEFREGHVDEDLAGFILLPRKYEEATGAALQDSFLIALLVNKTEEALGGFLRLQKDTLGTFDQALINCSEGLCRKSPIDFR